MPEFIRQRAKRPNRHADPAFGDAKETRDSSSAQLVYEAGKFFEGGFDRLLLDGKVYEVTDKSLTKQQHLRLFPQSPVETVDIKGNLLVKDEKVVNVGFTTPKVLKMSDTTLLRRGNPFKQGIFKRQTSRTKRVRMDEDTILPDYNRKK